MTLESQGFFLNYSLQASLWNSGPCHTGVLIRCATGRELCPIILQTTSCFLNYFEYKLFYHVPVLGPVEPLILDNNWCRSPQKTIFIWIKYVYYLKSNYLWVNKTWYLQHNSVFLEIMRAHTMIMGLAPWFKLHFIMAIITL